MNIGLRSKNNISQGGQANRSGQSAEDVICSIIERHGHLYCRQFSMGSTIYGHALKVDVFVYPSKAFPDGLVIESKWQDRAGSVDEKFPYLVMNIKQRMPHPTIVVYGGSGAKDGAIDWLRNQVGENLIMVCSLEEFISWANRSM